MARTPKAIKPLREMTINALNNLTSKCQAQGFQLIKLREIYSKQHLAGQIPEARLSLVVIHYPFKKGPYQVTSMSFR